MDKRRGNGVLLHLSSLPSPYGIGDLGKGAYRFADFLYKAKQKFWQILPLNPTDSTYENSPYSSNSAFAGNALFISPELLFEEGLLTREDILHSPSFPADYCDYDKAALYKRRILKKAYEIFQKDGKDKHSEYQNFCSENSNWLEDFALFVASREYFDGKPWNMWPQKVRDRNLAELQTLRGELKDRIEEEKFFQYLFFKQWFLLKNYCNQRGIKLIGDMPIYTTYDSVDVWTNSRLFKLNEKKKPSFVAGVPPDYFSKTGQLWGNPVYNWDVLRRTGYKWWIQRIKHNLSLFDMIRIDHFRGFVAYWEIPAGEKTAINGRWVEAPAEDFFNTLLKHFSYPPIIAEDLGIITPEVKEIMYRYNFPGMKILLFAFDEDPADHPYAPHNYTRNCIVYTGTHDNNTVKGWFEEEATAEKKERFFRYLGRKVETDQVHWEFIRLALMSVANRAIIPLQDILGLGERARMNRPATTSNNWQWRLLPHQITEDITHQLREITQVSGRG